MGEGREGTGVFGPACLLFVELPESDFADFLRIVDKFVSRYPEIVDAVEADLDLKGKGKKKVRLEDERWRMRKDCPALAGIEYPEEPIRAEELSLEEGRPRIPAYVAFIFLACRGYAGGESSRPYQDLVQESLSITLMLQRYNMKMPAESTLNENLNAVRNRTRRMIHQRQMEYALVEELDDFAEMSLDSSAVLANTAWPTDSTIILKLIDRIWRTGSDLERYGTENFRRHWTEQWLKKMRRENLCILMANSRRERASHYRQFYGFAERAIKHLEGERQVLEGRAEPHSMRPGLRRRFRETRRMLRRDLESARRMVELSRRRIEEGEQVPADQKVLSVADPDAAFIKKGQREPAIGYRPQVARSRNGLIGYLHVPEGNAADAPQLVGAVEGWAQSTGRVPDLVNTDDGYTSREGRDRLEEMGVETVSFSGSKGRRLLGEWEWWDEERMRARQERPAVESLMFTLKYCYRFGRLSRRGIEAVRAELWEDVLAYNFFRIVQLERRAEPEKVPRAA
jgi:hypothetical protein